jgi:hypothetical protein
MFQILKLVVYGYPRQSKETMVELEGTATLISKLVAAEAALELLEVTQ